jgi:hypothetical protein
LSARSGILTLATVISRSAVVAALACLALTACAGAQTTRTINNPIPVPSQSQLTGTVLESALLPLSEFPAGYQVDTQESWDTGASLLPGSPASAAAPGSCLQMAQSVKDPAGMTGGVSQVLYDASIDNPSSYHQRRYGQDVFQFATVSGSTTFFDFIRSTFTRCTSVKYKDATATTETRQSISPAPPVDGHQAVLVRQSMSGLGVNGDAVVLFATDGTDVYEVGATVFGVPLTAQPSTLTWLMADLITRVQTIKCALACPASAS